MRIRITTITTPVLLAACGVAWAAEDTRAGAFEGRIYLQFEGGPSGPIPTVNSPAST